MIKIKDNIYWVGIKDWEIKRFHGEEYSTHRGSTYNSYLTYKESGFEVAMEGIKMQYDPTPGDLRNCEAFGEEFAGKM